MNKRLLLLAVLAVVLAAMSVGFASAQDDTLVVWADEDRAPIIEELGAAFTEEYGIGVEVVQLGFGDIRDQLIIAGPAGEGPDILIGAHDWLGQLVTNDLLAPIELDEELAAQFSPVALQAFTYDGVLYGLPYAVENVALFRNTELVPDAPATWADVRAVSEELVSSGAADYGFVLQNGDAYHFFPLMSSFGGYIFGLDENNSYLADDVGVGSDGSIAALQWVSDMIADGLTPVTTGDEAVALFESGDAAFILTGPWFLERFAEAGVPYGISSVPTGPDDTVGGPFLGVQGFMVNSQSDNADLAVAFLTEFVATEDAMAQFVEAGNRPSALISVAEASENPDFIAFAEAGSVGLPMPAIPEMSAVWGALGNAISLTINGDLSAEEALTDANQQIVDTIAGTDATATP